ncbi:MAG: hypothetical protein ACJAZO_003037 [Myxococcota bacterium]|jgi:hypothetical protein
MRALLFIILTGCGTGLTELGTDTADTAIPSGDVVIDDVAPYWGPVAGGTLITISGVGFTDVESVVVGGLDLDFFRESAESIIVTTPPGVVEGPVELTITTGAGVARDPEGFWYSNSGAPDRGDGGTDTDPDTNGGGDVSATGMTGGLIELSMLQVACPACFNQSNGLQVSGAAAFHGPSPTSWTQWLPPSGSCAINPTRGGPTTPRVDVGEWVYLESGAASIPMRRTTGQGGLFYDAAGLTESDYRRNASFDVNVPDGGIGGSFRIDGGMESTEGFDSISPQEMLYVNPEAAFAASVSQQGQGFSWSPSGGVGNFLVQLDIYASDGSALVGSVVCYGPDNGFMTVPGGMLSNFPSYGLVAIGMYRYKVSETVIPSNGATLQAISQFGVMGTGTLVPF